MLLAGPRSPFIGMLFCSFIPGMLCFAFFFFNDPATPETSTLPLHDPLPIPRAAAPLGRVDRRARAVGPRAPGRADRDRQRYRLAGDRQAGRRPDQAAPGAAADQGGRLRRSEEHTSELQSQSNLVCRLLLEKK